MKKTNIPNNSVKEDQNRSDQNKMSPVQQSSVFKSADSERWTSQDNNHNLD